MTDLKKRLLGKYSCGPNGIREDRDFGDYTPGINKEAVARIEELESELTRANALTETQARIIRRLVDENLEESGEPKCT